MKEQFPFFSLQEIVEKLFSQTFIPWLLLRVCECQLHRNKSWIRSVSFSKIMDDFFRRLGTPFDIRIVFYVQQGVKMVSDSSLSNRQVFFFMSGSKVCSYHQDPLPWSLLQTTLLFLNGTRDVHFSGLSILRSHIILQSHYDVGNCCDLLRSDAG